MSNENETSNSSDPLQDLKERAAREALHRATGVVDINSRRLRDDRAIKVKEFAQEFMARYYEAFRIVYDNRGMLSCAEVVSPGVLRPIEDQYVINRMLKFFVGRTTAPEVKVNIFPTWRVLMAAQTGVPTSSIVPLVFKSDTTTPWAWQRLDFDPIEIECPVLLTKMLERTSPEEGRSLVLWLGSLLDFNFPRSQYLYLHGDGNDGKSTLIAMLNKLLGVQGVAMMRSDDFGDAHSTTVLEGARLAIFADENSASFMSRGRFKALTGDDTLTINPKGLPRRNIVLNCKVMVASNYPPHVQGGRADLRRIIPVRLQPIPEAESSHAEGKAFVEAHSAIMQYCYSEFRRWQTEQPDRMIPAAQSAMDDVVADSMQSETDVLLDTHLVFATERAISAATLQTFLRAQVGTRAPLMSLYQAIKRRGAKRRQIRDGETRTWMWSGVAIRAPQ